MVRRAGSRSTSGTPEVYRSAIALPRHTTPRKTYFAQGAIGGRTPPDDADPQCPPGTGVRSRCGLGRSDVLGPRTLRTLTDREGHALTLAERVERSARAGGLVEEVLGAVGRRDESKALVGETLDCAGA